MVGTAVVTGGTRGIGLEISKSLKAQGYEVVALYRGNEEAAQQFRNNVGGEALRCDVSNYEEVQRTVQHIEDEYGDIDVLVNNAGITRDHMLHKMSIEDWHAVIESNLTSCFNMCHAVVPGMRQRGFGRIINISSVNGQKGQFGQTNYAAAKAGILGFTKALALEVAAKGITVNAVCPGYVESDMTASMKPDALEGIVKQIPMGRMGHPEEVAGLVSFLVSEPAAYMTGATLAENGGQYMA